VGFIIYSQLSSEGNEKKLRSQKVKIAYPQYPRNSFGDQVETFVFFGKLVA